MLKLDPISGHSSQQTALDLLHEGFPERSREFWAAGFKAAAPTAERSGIPVGQILLSKGVPSGIILTFGSGRDARKELVVNLSAWYVRPEQRFLAPAMLKLITSGEATYTDLTPTPDVARLSHALGFRAATIGTVVVPLPAAALLPGRGVELCPWRSLALPDSATGMATDHEALGCRVYGVQTQDGAGIIILRQARYFRLRSAEVVFGRRDLLRQAIGPIAKALLQQGILSLVYDCDTLGAEGPLAIRRRTHTPRMLKGYSEPGVIDYAWSELPLLNP
jgi:hypothetical protein